MFKSDPNQIAALFAANSIEIGMQRVQEQTDRIIKLRSIFQAMGMESENPAFEQMVNTIHPIIMARLGTVRDTLLNQAGEEAKAEYEHHISFAHQHVDSFLNEEEPPPEN